MTGRIYVGRYLTALDGYTVPIRIGSYALDTYYNPGTMYHNCVAVIRDSISNRDSYIGGTVEKGESLLEALTGECAEEGGLAYDPEIVHPKVSAILSLDTPDRFSRLNDQTLIFDPDDKVYRPAEVNQNYINGSTPASSLLKAIPHDERIFQIGDPFKLRNVFRTKSTHAPEQQPAREDEVVPEAVNPHYELLLPSEAEFRVLRPSFCTAIKIADKLDALYSIIGRKVVEPDLDDLATQWEAYNIHPLAIDILCKKGISLAQALKDYETISQKMGLNDNATIDALMKNLHLADAGLHHLLRQKLPHDKEIREILNIMNA